MKKIIIKLLIDAILLSILYIAKIINIGELNIWQLILLGAVLGGFHVEGRIMSDLEQ